MKRWVNWKMSVVWIVWMSSISAWNIFGSVHPWYRALLLWYIVPFVGGLAYLFGRMDERRKKTQQEIDQLEKEIADIQSDMQVMHMRTKFHFKKDDSVN
jgi:hypothetical protein